MSSINGDFIRIGNPSINLAESQVFILSDADQLGCDRLALNTITIQESDNPIIRGRDGEGIKITLPEHLKWDPNYINSLDIQVPDDKFDGSSPRLDDDGHSLLFDLINGAHLLPQDIITIDGAYVIPQSLSDFNVDQNTLLGLSVNDKIDGFDTDENQQSNYLAVDDFRVKLFKEVDPLLSDLGLGQSNTDDASFVLTDNNPSIGSIEILSVSGADSPWPLFKDRKFEIRLPDDISFNNPSLNNGDIESLVGNTLNLNTYSVNGEDIADITISGQYDIFSYQPADFIDISTNSLSIDSDES